MLCSMCWELEDPKCLAWDPEKSKDWKRLGFFPLYFSISQRRQKSNQLQTLWEEWKQTSASQRKGCHRVKQRLIHLGRQWKLSLDRWKGFYELERVGGIPGKGNSFSKTTAPGTVLQVAEAQRSQNKADRWSRLWLNRERPKCHHGHLAFILEAKGRGTEHVVDIHHLSFIFPPSGLTLPLAP